MLSQEVVMSWLVLLARILLPIVIFIITFGPKAETWLSRWGPSHSRDTMMAVRKSVAKRSGRPECLETMTVATAEKYPELFQKPEPPPERSRKKSEDNKILKKPVEKVRKDSDEAAEKEEAPAPWPASNHKKQSTAEPFLPEEVPPPAEDPIITEQMHFESLMNFVAFNRRHPQRVYLPVGGTPPPPPKKSSFSASAVSIVKGLAADQANKEAQMVLKGVLQIESSGSSLTSVPRGLYEQLCASSVEIQKSTYALMVESCIKVRDLAAASDFLVKVEAAGFALPPQLLDKVMEAYWSQNEDSSPSASPFSEQKEPIRSKTLPVLMQLREQQHQTTRPLQKAASPFSSEASRPTMAMSMQPMQQPGPYAPQQMPMRVMQQQVFPTASMQPPSFQTNAYQQSGPAGMDAAWMNPYPAGASSGPWYGNGVPPPPPGPPCSGMQVRGSFGSTGAMMFQKREIDPDLPAFSIPEEFANKDADMS